MLLFQAQDFVTAQEQFVQAIIKYPFFVSSNFFIVVLKLYFSNATFLLLS